MSLAEAILRIREMEQRFDRLLERKIQDQVPKDDPDRAILAAYYESGLWLADYTLDEQGLLPRDLKRGVLSQDGLWDLLEGSF
jgi:hypothetical protein